VDAKPNRTPPLLGITLMTQTVSKNPPLTVTLLGYGGLVPFIALSSLEWLNPVHAEFWHEALLAYAAVILSFVGALHWGFAMFAGNWAPRARMAGYVWSVVPSLVAWVALLLPSPLGGGLLVVFFIAHYARDVRVAPVIQVPDWYLPLRWRLSLMAVLSITAGEMALRGLHG
jgi:hypothetical protein